MPSILLSCLLWKKSIGCTEERSSGTCAAPIFLQWCAALRQPRPEKMFYNTTPSSRQTQDA
eukprot:4063574-Amphidinium_carterae.1